jgi:hypothetical protein
LCYFFISLSVYFALEQKNMMINEKKSKLINLTEVAYSIIENEYKLFIQGKLNGYESMPDNIPKSPYRYYASDGWVGFKDWLGT